ncbi:MAG: hypothetical protein ACYC3I_08060 [Gemmataceae bacterium]
MAKVHRIYTREFKLEAWTEADVKGWVAAVAKLPGEEKAWVEDILPSTRPTDLLISCLRFNVLVRIFLARHLQ